MPDIYAHTLCAEGALNHLPIYVRDIIENNMAAYRLGAQGPDFFFYYHIEPWKNNEGFPKVGNTVHQEHIDRFFTVAANYIRDNQEVFSKEKQELYLAYIGGFLTHYILDSSAHPYIYYISGIDGGKNHKYLEGSIDTYLMLFYGARDSGKLIKQEEPSKSDLAELLQYLMEEVFAISLEKQKIMESFDDFSRIISLLYDPGHLKKPLFSKLDKTLGLDGFLITGATPTKLVKGVDYLNLKKKTWCNPVDVLIQSNDSFLDIHEKAKRLSANLIASMFEYIQGKDSDFPENIGNKSYDTGLPGKHKMKFDHIVIDWEKAYK